MPIFFLRDWIGASRGAPARPSQETCRMRIESFQFRAMFNTRFALLSTTLDWANSSQSRQNEGEETGADHGSCN
jgi:hypothetical protein